MMVPRCGHETIAYTGGKAGTAYLSGCTLCGMSASSAERSMDRAEPTVSERGSTMPDAAPLGVPTEGGIPPKGAPLTDGRAGSIDADIAHMEALEAAGLCQLCETRPVAPDDCFCVECRAETDTLFDEVTDPIEHLLNEHARFEPLCHDELSFCRCGARFSGGPGYHRRHVAELIYDTLGIPGPSRWEFGSNSDTWRRFDHDGRIVADGD